MTLLDKFFIKLFRRKPKITMQGVLSARVFRANGDVEVLGVLSKKLITNAFAQYVVDSFQDSTTYPIDVFKYHDSGTGVVAENAADTGLGTPCGEARDAGSQGEGAANVYKTIATHTYNGAFAITEHGVFSVAVAGVLMDRSVFAPINVLVNDEVEFTYEVTVNSGG